MTALALPTSPAACPRLVDDAPVLAWTGIALAALCLPLALAVLLDGRSVDGEAAFLKPLKFAAALALFALTLAWSARLLPTPVRHRRGLARFDSVVAICIWAEVAWIAGAAALGVRSHYNETQPLLAAVYPVMGLVALTLTAGALVRGWLVLRHGTGPIAPAVGWSFVATFALTVPVAMALSAVRPDGAGVPLLGWTLLPGDLRPAHFLAVHAMQAVPLAAAALLALRLPPRGRTLTAAWSALTLAAFAYGLGAV